MISTLAPIANIYVMCGSYVLEWVTLGEGDQCTEGESGVEGRWPRGNRGHYRRRHQQRQSQAITTSSQIFVGKSEPGQLGAGQGPGSRGRVGECEQCALCTLFTLSEPG